MKNIWDDALLDTTFLRQVRAATSSMKKLLIATTMEYKAAAFPTEHPSACVPIISGVLLFYCQKLMPGKQSLIAIQSCYIRSLAVHHTTRNISKKSEPENT